MSAYTKLIKDGNNTVYPVTIPAAIIDPQTGQPVNFSTGGGTAAMEYTINNKTADANGNFTITAADLGAAVTGHTHGVSDVSGLQAALDGLAVTGHTHTMVSGIVAGGSTVSGTVYLRGTGNVQITQSGDVISIRVTPYTVDTANSVTAADTEHYKVFVGTESEWEAFAAGTTVGENYLVFIRS